jgi:hypothetical protein
VFLGRLVGCVIGDYDAELLYLDDKAVTGNLWISRSDMMASRFKFRDLSVSKFCYSSVVSFQPLLGQTDRG